MSGEMIGCGMGRNERGWRWYLLISLSNGVCYIDVLQYIDLLWYIDTIIAMQDRLRDVSKKKEAVTVVTTIYHSRQVMHILDRCVLNVEFCQDGSACPATCIARHYYHHVRLLCCPIPSPSLSNYVCVSVCLCVCVFVCLLPLWWALWVLDEP